MAWDISEHAAYAGGLATRVADLRQRFPDALVTCDVDGNFSGPELICWNAHPREIWVWVFEPDDAAGARRASARLEQFIAAPHELTDVVDKPVVAGPNDVFDKESVTASSYFDVDGRIEVRNGPTDGIQLFRAFGIDGFDDIANRVAINLVLGAAYKADRDSRRALGFRRAGLPVHSPGDERV
ncbi:hypothetical protein AB0I95_25525 [Micromonospora sp. NPDC049751]|uniref:hypothetical protein n=1 Tax=Micromonospora sp. NPDC049751 TaxID=3154837 RepID=UPI00340820EC